MGSICNVVHTAQNQGCKGVARNIELYMPDEGKAWQRDGSGSSAQAFAVSRLVLGSICSVQINPCDVTVKPECRSRFASGNPALRRCKFLILAALPKLSLRERYHS